MASRHVWALDQPLQVSLELRFAAAQKAQRSVAAPRLGRHRGQVVEPAEAQGGINGVDLGVARRHAGPRHLAPHRREGSGNVVDNVPILVLSKVLDAHGCARKVRKVCDRGGGPRDLGIGLLTGNSSSMICSAHIFGSVLKA